MKSGCLAHILITPHALFTLVRDDLAAALEEHIIYDVGDICPDHGDGNEDAPKREFCLVSSCRDSKGTSFWIISEPNVSTSTVLLAEEKW
jgi:hypothetical protein